MYMYRHDNAPIAGTESIDRIGKCHSGLWGAINSSRKTDVLVILTSQIMQSGMLSPYAHWTAAAPTRPIAVPGHDTLSRDIMHIVRYCMVPTLRYDSQTFTQKSCTAQCAVQCAWKVVTTREES